MVKKLLTSNTLIVRHDHFDVVDYVEIVLWREIIRELLNWKHERNKSQKHDQI